ncbi:MAG: site-specific DNA-methyltransferase [Gemmatales bacterium]|nr:site-specific DNA-methyltransferase [Gemmatales bacterium]MDW8175929.1 site-specific DNA-methyltransferase [Gemmatales bacterium]
MSVPRLYFEHRTVKLYCDDFLQASYLPPVDLIVTSPPYNVDIAYETYHDAMPYEKYLDFTEQWLSKCFDLAKDDGRMCINIPLDKNKGGHQSVYADVTMIAKRVGWRYHTTIIWNEQNISRRTAWGSWCSARAPFVIAPVEMIVVFYKKQWRKRRHGTSDISREEFKEWTNGVWTFPGENRKRLRHPAPFPLELPKRCIKLFSYVQDVVLDPFVGSGTTLVACLELNRVGIGVEINPNYCQLAKNRLKRATNCQLDFMVT